MRVGIKKNYKNYIDKSIVDFFQKKEINFKPDLQHWQILFLESKITDTDSQKTHTSRAYLC